MPLKDGVVTDDTRIRETLPTLKLAMEKGGRLVLASHLGRSRWPRSKIFPEARGEKLEELWASRLHSLTDCIGPDAEAKNKALKDGDVLVLENVRFTPKKKKNDESFSKQLAALCDGVFVCDAFGSAHRAHASVVGITKFVKHARRRFADGKRTRVYRQSHQQSRDPSWQFLAAQESTTKSKSSKTS